MVRRTQRSSAHRTWTRDHITLDTSAVRAGGYGRHAAVEPPERRDDELSTRRQSRSPAAATKRPAAASASAAALGSTARSLASTLSPILNRHCFLYPPAAMVGPAAFMANWCCPPEAATCRCSLATTSPFRSSNSNRSLYGAFGLSRVFVHNPLHVRPVFRSSRTVVTRRPRSGASRSAIVVQRESILPFCCLRVRHDLDAGAVHRIAAISGAIARAVTESCRPRAVLARKIRLSGITG